MILIKLLTMSKCATNMRNRIILLVYLQDKDNNQDNVYNTKDDDNHVFAMQHRTYHSKTV